ncbi:hypothetical protein [Bacteroides sp. 51]|uniref:hypothetical protein n=1 Tax=Bacteroides sp. 51 TaxID=2302938 RepID=UPI0013D1956F|nr:hypothetical protein [Bacteroides sp. 51]NDV81308.1 hypothetical protein [Bacteroides sp. 51]
MESRIDRQLRNEAEEYKRLEKLLNVPKLEKPKDFEVEKCIEALEKRLQEKRLPGPVRVGYTNAVKVLEDRITKYNQFDFSPIDSIQSRAIIMLAIDFLNGECSKKVLCGIAIKQKDKWRKNTNVG